MDFDAFIREIERNDWQVYGVEAYREGGYGYFFWKYRSGFSMNGKWGQKCFILPEEKTMICFLSLLEQGSDGLRASAERYLLD